MISRNGNLQFTMMVDKNCNQDSVPSILSIPISVASEPVKKCAKALLLCS